ncbi:MAG: trigger factor [Acidimicrobiia bacterium]
METQVETLDGNSVRLTVTVPADEFESAIDAAFRRIAHEVRVPGFRPGKAPRQLLEKQFGSEVGREQALKDSLPEYYLEAIMTEHVDVIAPPELQITAGEEDGDVTFEAVVEVRPEVELIGYDALTLTIEGATVSDDAIEEQVESLRARFADLADSTDPLADDDYASIDITTTIDDEQLDALSATDYLYQVGSERIVPELDDALRGKSAGENVEFDVTLPEGDFEGSGADAHMSVAVKETKQRVLPEVTDEWIGDVTEFDTVDDFRADLVQRLERLAKLRAQMQVREKVLEAVADLVPVVAPETLVNQESERRLHDFSHDLSNRGMSIDQYLMATGVEPDEFVNDLKDGATKAVLADLGLRAVARAESLEATDAELDREIELMAERSSTKPNKVRKELERRGAMDAVRSEISRGKALQFLVDHASAVDEDGNPIDLSLDELADEVASATESAGEGKIKEPHDVADDNMSDTPTEEQG